MKPITSTAILILALVVAGHANAADDEDRRKDKPHRKAPPAALEACASLVEGDPCAFTGRRDEEVQGSCFAPSDKTLACRPDSPPPRLRREQPEVEET